LGEVPATVRVDKEKTAIVHGAGAWGEINPPTRYVCIPVNLISKLISQSRAN
jgi:hypothetical protein